MSIAKELAKESAAHLNLAQQRHHTMLAQMAHQLAKEICPYLKGRSPADTEPDVSLFDRVEITLYHRLVLQLPQPVIQLPRTMANLPYPPVQEA